jgi:micrococcal nuclease
VRLYTAGGGDTATKLYWGIGEKGVWNNDGDTAYLRAPDGTLVDLFTY